MDYSERLALNEAGVWVTKDGRQVAIVDMDDQHLENLIKWLARTARELLSTALHAAYSMEMGLQGEMALDQIGRDIAWLESMDWTDVFMDEPITSHVIAEIRRRGWTWDARCERFTRPRANVPW